MRRVVIIAVLWASSADAGTVTIKGNTYTYPDHPRVFFDGPSGTITTGVKDPDGAGPLIAPQATESAIAYAGLQNAVRGCRAAPNYCASDRSSYRVVQLALDWYMDNSQTESLAAAIYNLNNVETWITNGYGFGCDVSQANCGLSSWIDWPSADLANIAQAYSLVRSEMSAGERTALTQKMFNDDVKEYEDGCNNQLQPYAGATATYTSGSSTVTGSGFTGMTPGLRVYFRSTTSTTYSWAYIQSVDSDTQLTLTTPPQGALGGNAPSISGGMISQLNPWNSSTCGLVWMLSHYSPYSVPEIMDPVTLTTSANVNPADTTIHVVSTSGLPEAPFYVVLYTGETLHVSSYDATSLTVTRATLGTALSSGTLWYPKLLYYSRYAPNRPQPYTDYCHNLIIQRTFGYIAAGLAFADDSTRAKEFVTSNAGAWIDNIYASNKDMWTGFQQSGSSNYGPGRQLTFNVGIVSLLRGLSGTPALDYSSGAWLSNLVRMWLYTSLPTDPTQFVPWGQPDIATSPSWYTHSWEPQMVCALGADTDDAKWWSYWTRTLTNQYTTANFTYGVNDRLLQHVLPCLKDDDPTEDYRAVLPTEHAFNQVQGTTGKALNAWVSRTGWTSASDSLIFMDVMSRRYTQDHIGNGQPGAYKIFKGGWTLSENTAYDTGGGADSNMILFGGAANLQSPTTLTAYLDRASSGTGWAYSRADLSQSYSAATAVTKALRQLVHFKKSANPDYLVVYDSAATSNAKAIGQNLHYDKTSGEASSLTDTLPNIVWTGPSRSVRTKVVLPAGTGVAKTASSLTNSFREYLCASSDGTTCASVTSASFLLVHKPAASASDTMPTVNALATVDSDFDGVEIADASAPSVAVFAKTADQNAGSFTTTLAGTAQIIVTGLVAGTYDVTQDGGAYLADQSVDANGVLAFTGTAAAYALSQTGVATPPTITTTTLANGVKDQPYCTQLQATDGALPFAWDVSAGSLCTGLTLSESGSLCGTPTAAGSCSFTARVTDNLAQTDTQALSLTIQSPPPTLTVTAQPGSNSVVVGFSTPGLAYGQSCDVAVSQTTTVGCQPGESVCVVQAGTGTSSQGLSQRQVSVTGLSASLPSTAQVTCGTAAAGSANFTTEAAKGSATTYSFTAKVPAYVKALATANAVLNRLGLVVCFDADCGGEYTCKMASSCPGDVCTISRSLTAGVHYVWHRWSDLPAGAEVCAENLVYATTAHRKGYVAIP